MSEELLACPFCGNPPVVSERDPILWEVACFEDACDVNPGALGQTRAEAIAAWNRRPEPSAALRPADDGKRVGELETAVAAARRELVELENDAQRLWEMTKGIGADFKHYGIKAARETFDRHFPAQAALAQPGNDGRKA